MGKKCLHNPITFRWTGDEKDLKVQAGCSKCDSWGAIKKVPTGWPYDKFRTQCFALQDFLWNDHAGYSPEKDELLR